MNAFLWLGVASTLVLVAALVFDGFDGVFGALDGIDFGGDWLSLPVLAAFLGAFGFGAGATYPTIGIVAVIPGLVAGVAFAVLAVRLVSVAQGDAGGPVDSAASLLGALGTIVTPPGIGSLGEVMVIRQAGPVKLACRAAAPIPLGTEVVVVDVASSTLVTVEPFNQE